MFKNFADLIINPTNNKRKVILYIIIIFLCLLLFIITINSLFYGENSLSSLSNWADLTKYQAVFLTNGQVYFGKVIDVNRQTLILEDIYYLRASRDLQASQESSQATTTEEILADNFSLIKLGSEIHGPEDKMSINLNQVMFVEDLKDSSKVVEAIKAYQSKK